MDKFYFEIPSIKREEEAFQYIQEFIEYNSVINGVGGLDNYNSFYDYKGWLKKLEEDYVTIPSELRVPSRTYFLIRESDNKIIGMSNIRLALNSSLRHIGGHIGYSIRPTERGKGYNHINLYLGLKICQKYGIKEIMLDALKSNIASWKTMESLGGVMVKEHYEDFYNESIKDYIFDVDKCIEKNKDLYEQYVLETR